MYNGILEIAEVHLNIQLPIDKEISSDNDQKQHQKYKPRKDEDNNTEVLPADEGAGIRLNTPNHLNGSLKVAMTTDSVHPSEEINVKNDTNPVIPEEGSFSILKWPSNGTTFTKVSNII